MSAIIATIPAPASNTIEVGPLTIHYYGIAIALGVLLAITVLRRRYAAVGGDPDLADRTALWTVAFGFLGARLAYVLPRAGDFLERPLSIFAVWEGGLALFGGLLFGCLAAVWYLRRNGAAVPPFADAVAPAIPLAQAVGRWGNYFNQELYGTPTDVPWALEVDPDRRVAGYEAFETFHPTFLYESLYNLALAAVIVWLGRRGKLRQGSLLLVYGIGYGLGRFAIELIRTDTTFRVMGLSRNNWVALVVLVAAIVALRWWQSRGGDGAPRVGDPIVHEPVLDAEGGASQEPVGDEPVGDEPVGDEPVGDEPVGDEPVGDEPVGDEPVGEKPVGDDTAIDEPMTEERVTDSSVIHSPTAGGGSQRAEPDARAQTTAGASPPVDPDDDAPAGEPRDSHAG